MLHVQCHAIWTQTPWASLKIRKETLGWRLKVPLPTDGNMIWQTLWVSRFSVTVIEKTNMKWYLWRILYHFVWISKDVTKKFLSMSLLNQVQMHSIKVLQIIFVLFSSILLRTNNKLQDLFLIFILFKEFYKIYE